MELKNIYFMFLKVNACAKEGTQSQKYVSFLPSSLLSCPRDGYCYHCFNVSLVEAFQISKSINYLAPSSLSFEPTHSHRYTTGYKSRM